MQLSSPVPHKRARIEIIPLIDIMFFLLASFMMVSLSQTHMKGIRVNLPAAVGPPPEGKVDFVSVKVLEETPYFSTMSTSKTTRCFRGFLHSTGGIRTSNSL
jgi:biopolymer transport protein ExbD